MSDDPSMMGAFGRAANEAAQGAMIGHAIGKLNNEVEEAISLANRWRDYARDLEQKIARMQASDRSVQLETEVIRLKDRLNTTIDRKTAREEEWQKFNTFQYERYVALWNALKNLDEYGDRMNFRLYTIEKALRHSSADNAALKYCLNSLKSQIQKHNLQDFLIEEVEKNAQIVRDNFINSKNLTEDSDIQEIINQGSPQPIRPDVLPIFQKYRKQS